MVNTSFFNKIMTDELSSCLNYFSGNEQYKMKSKVYNAVISRQSDNNIKYTDFQSLIIDLGFVFERQRGSHVVYYHNDIDEFMNIQPDGNKAKGYQVRQLRGIIFSHGL